jgi:peptidyl-prolyl cis-trans isomerase SurA
MRRMIKAFCLLITITFSGGLIYAQSTQEPLLDIAGEKISKEEFLKVYQKNNIKGEALDRKAVEEYLDLYINFRLKVREATSLGMDTIKSFKDELLSYRKQLAQPYLTDNDMLDKLLGEAYEHKKYDVRASHILFKVEKLASATDTLEAWNRAMKARERILKGEDFGKVALEMSSDSSVKDRTIQGRRIKGNRGDLGYFTAFDMVYPFEEAVYNLKVGEISKPVRTEFGYHIIKLTDKQPAIGKIQLAHVLLLFPPNSTLKDSLNVKDSAYKAYSEIKSGTEFASVTKMYSDDKSTADKAGLLPWFSINRLLPEFVVEINKLKNKNEFSSPFRSAYGWHIIKLIDRKPIGKFEDEKDDLKQKVLKNDRSALINSAFVGKSVKTFGFTEYPESLALITSLVTDSIFNATWKIPALKMPDKPIFKIGNREVLQSEFASYLMTNQSKSQKYDTPAYVNDKYTAFKDITVVKFADSQLENQYPDFKSLMKEYHDGILLFDLTDKKVWTKAVKDTLGLENYYEEHKSEQMWDTRLDATIFTLKDLSKEKQLKKVLKKSLADDLVLSKINSDTIQAVSSIRNKFLKGDNNLIDTIQWAKGVYGPFAAENNAVVYIRVNQIVQPEPKKLNEVRGIMTSDYQNYLEKQWIDELRHKYNFTLNHDVFESIFK